MEGLFIAKMVEDIARLLPIRTLGWAFPNETTAALRLETKGNIVFQYRPPAPALYLEEEHAQGSPHNSFQRMLARRARGSLESITQLKLDRVVCFRFSGESGFVDVPPVTLIFELTGRNSSMILLESTPTEWTGRILATAREVPSNRNRFRTTRTGGLYTPPPPYQKIDPRRTSLLELMALETTPLTEWHRHVDGLGPTLTAELAHRAAVPLREIPVPMDRVHVALHSLVQDPSLSSGSLSRQAWEIGRTDREHTLRKTLREPLEKRKQLLGHQLGDLEKARQAEEQGHLDRAKAELLLAYAHTAPATRTSVVDLPNFVDGTPVTIALDPSLSWTENAKRLYAKVKRRQEVLKRLEERAPQLQAELLEVESQLQNLLETPLETLESWIQSSKQDREDTPKMGHAFSLENGTEIRVGRNNKENDYLTHRWARSMDHWFHAQGYPGSHVIVRSGPRDLHLDEILCAAAIAAYYSKARNGTNIPVDYTRIKYVWKQKGAGAGKVHYTHEKTVFVDPKLPS